MSKYGKEIEEYVLKDVEDGMKINISATPTIFINGRKIEGFVPPVILDIIFRRILSTLLRT
jgi:protein-disulfide isomerase